PRRIGGIVAEPGDVIEIVRTSACFLPHAEAEVAILRRTGGVHDLGLVAVPDNDGVVDHGVGVAGDWVSVHRVGGEDHVPHSDDRWGIVIIVVEKGGAHQVSRTDLWMPAGGFNEVLVETALCRGARDHEHSHHEYTQCR